MNINRILLDGIAPFLESYYCKYSDIKEFLVFDGSFEERQRKAIHIIEDIMVEHRKEDLLRNVEELANVEYAIRELQPSARDHVVHALLSFILGVYINENFLKPVSSVGVDRFQWKLAGLLHDIGYPAEVAQSAILRHFAETINEIKRRLDVEAPDVGFKVVPFGFEELTDGFNSFDLIQNRLNSWGLQINARGEYNEMIKSKEIRHDIISSLAILHVVDFLYHKYNPERRHKAISPPPGKYFGHDVNFNQKYFEEDVVSACAAIYIHSLPGKCFDHSKIDRSRAPVAFLLKLSDALQIWKRPSIKNPTGFAASLFDIEVVNGELRFRADIPKSEKDKINNEISSVLIAQDIRIR